MFIQHRYFKFYMWLKYFFFHFNDATIETLQIAQDVMAAIKFLLFCIKLHDRSLLMSRRSGIFLFNARGTCARCLGIRRRFNVNMGFTDDYKF